MVFKHHPLKENSYPANQSKQLNKTAPLKECFLQDDLSSGDLQDRVLLLEMQNSKYLEKLAKLENELALAYSFKTGQIDSGKKITNSDIEKSRLAQKLKELELQNIKLIENNEYLVDRLNQLELEYNHMKSYLDVNLEQYEKLYNMVQNNEDSKENLSRHAKKLDGSLKSLNQNYILLQKKVASLEKENKEITANLRACEAEKRNISEKWQKLSKKVRLENEFLKSTKNLELEISKYQIEVQEYKEKYLTKDTQLRALKDEEKNYKALLEENAKIIKDLKGQIQEQAAKNNMITDQNLELKQRLQELEEKTKNIMLSGEQQQTEEAESLDPQDKLICLNHVVEQLSKEKRRLEETCNVLKEELAYENRKWQFLIKDHEQLQKDHKKLLAEYQEEHSLTESLQQVSISDSNTSASTRKLESIYDELKDPWIELLRNELLRIKDIDDETYCTIERYLNMHLKFIFENKVPKQIEDKYNRLLVKYYKAIEKTKSLEKEAKENPKKTIQTNHVNLDINSLAKSIGCDSQKSSLKIPRLNLQDKLNLSSLTPSNVSHQVFISQGSTISQKNQEGTKPCFRPLERVLLNTTSFELKKTKNLQDNKGPKGGYKENIVPNNSSNKPGTDYKRAVSNKRPSIFMDSQDMKNQSANSGAIRSLSHDKPKEEKSQENLGGSNLQTSNFQNLGNSGSINFSITDMLKCGEKVRMRNIGDARNYSTKNRSYLDLHLSRKGRQQSDLNSGNNSFSFISNI